MTEINPAKVSYTIPMSREMAIAYGAIEPTDAERQQLEAERAKYDAWHERQRTRHVLAVATLQARGTLERRLLDLHSADDDGRCQGCDVDGYEAEQPIWPCRTVAALAEHHGLDLEEPR